MHSPSHAACIYQLGSFWFNLQGLTRASFYTNQRLHQPAFTQTPFYTKHFLQKFTPSSFYTNPLLQCFYTNSLFHKPPFTSFYTNQLLHKRAFTRISLYANIANQLFDQPAFTQTTFCTNQLLQTSFYTNQLLHKPALHKPTFRQATFYYMQTTFYTNQLYTTPALGLLAKGQRAGGMPKALKYMSKHTSMYIHVYPGGIFTGFTTWSKYVNIVVSLQ
jgi:hypothetical protein